jgi:hypothetical protein
MDVCTAEAHMTSVTPLRSYNWPSGASLLPTLEILLFPFAPILQKALKYKGDQALPATHLKSSWNLKNFPYDVLGRHQKKFPMANTHLIPTNRI